MSAPGGPFRMLVTGSRDWGDRGRVARELTEAACDLAGIRPIVLVHGACPTGADVIAGAEARRRGWRAEPHPAQWRQFGDAAGPRRNAEMVALGADVCLCFLMPCRKRGCAGDRPHDSHGARGCAELAEKAGIPVWRFRP